MLEISGHCSTTAGWKWRSRAFPPDFLIAAMVWLIPGAETAQFHVITLMTYLIAVGGFMHIVAGSVEAFLLVINGGIGCGHGRRLLRAGARRQHHRRHGAVRADRLRAGHEGDEIKASAHEEEAMIVLVEVAIAIVPRRGGTPRRARAHADR